MNALEVCRGVRFLTYFNLIYSRGHLVTPVTSSVTWITVRHLCANTLPDYAGSSLLGDCRPRERMLLI